MFCEIVGKIFIPESPYDKEHFVFDTVYNPEETYIDCFNYFLFDRVIWYPHCSFVVGGNRDGPCMVHGLFFQIWPLSLSCLWLEYYRCNYILDTWLPCLIIYCCPCQQLWHCHLAAFRHGVVRAGDGVWLCVAVIWRVTVAVMLRLWTIEYFDGAPCQITC